MQPFFKPLTLQAAVEADIAAAAFPYIRALLGSGLTTEARVEACARMQAVHST